MTVYVDDSRNRFRRMVCCHMVADSHAELHAEAERLGCRREWFQGYHYDLPLFRRREAVLAGAAEVTAGQMAMMTAAMRRGRPELLLAPEAGREWLERWKLEAGRGRI